MARDDLDAQFGPGAEAADAEAARDEEIADDILRKQFGIDAYNIGDQDLDTLYEVVFEALKRGRAESHNYRRMSL